ncbi:hypothetical protein BDV38DRAFT_237643 [Aspergillus pseudotamarii]|uniref:Uncharacterized protein n=1 Tax=Aspergillus pseudotamarii TaxID=132259 RepID=A0A5N6T4M2_ASPPS|nr:uncharacterized protein BDV38DRAFT_237643 [Aspergillus pseudotamarii]KAE8141258.1 hypothetical protein BDV38DRAFT_237643 [Aspergillus pseudotamarii]
MVREDKISSRFNSDEFNRPGQTSPDVSNISGEQTGALTTYVTEQGMLYFDPSRQQLSSLEQFTLDAGTQISHNVSTDPVSLYNPPGGSGLPGSESVSTFLDSFDNMGPYSSGNQCLQDDFDDKSNDKELPSTFMGDLVQYESIGPLELDDIENSRFECDSFPSWKDIATSPPLTPINDSKPLVRRLYHSMTPPSIGTAELHALFDEGTDELPGLFDEDIVLLFPEDFGQEDYEALFSQTFTAQLDQNAIPPSRSTPLDGSPPPRSPDDRDQLPSVQMALHGALRLEVSTIASDGPSRTANPPPPINSSSGKDGVHSPAAIGDFEYRSSVGVCQQLEADATPFHGRETGAKLDEVAPPSTTDPSMEHGYITSLNSYDRSGFKKEAYVLAFAEELFSSMHSYNLDAGVLEHMYQALPGFLEVFALSFAHNRQTHVHREIMAFVYQHRCDIAVALREKLSEGLLAQRPSRHDDGMPLPELIDWWKSTKDEGNDDVLDVILTDSSSEAVIKESDDVTALTTSAQEPQCASDIDSNAESENRDQCADEAANIFPEILPYISLICESGAYSDLVANIQKACFLSSPQPNTIKGVRDVVLEVLHVTSFISRRTIPESYSMVYTMSWDLPAFVSEQEYHSAAHIAMEGSITLTGSENELQALACGEYIVQTWPSMGPSVLVLVKEAARWPRQKHEVVLPDGSIIRAFPCNTYDTYEVMVSGPSYTIAEVGEMLAWLGSTFRTSPCSEGVIYRQPFALKSESPSSYPGAFGCRLDYVERKGDASASKNGNCWHDLFRNPVVVEGYPIKRRRATALGVEIPLRMIAELMQTKRMNPFAGNIVLKGYSTILVPTAYEDGIISWHLLCNRTGDRISYLSGMAIPQVGISITQLERSRHVIGWCRDMKFHAGGPDACYDVKGSRLPRTQERNLLANVSISMGQLLIGDSSFILGRKDTPVHISRNGYIRKLKWISKKYVLLWDEADKRGWVVNGTSALLHLVYATLEQDKRDGFQGVSLFEMNKVQWAKQPYQAKSALQVLLNQSNLQLRVYPEKDGYTRLQDHVESLFDTLEKIIDHQHGIMGEPPGLDISRASLEGWDFNDLISERDPIYPRVSVMDTNGKSWIDFTRSIHAITLFGRGFQDIIQPMNVCPCWATVPKDMSYIAVCQDDLEDIMEAAGDPSSKPVRLTDRLIWHTPEVPSGTCHCPGSDGTTHLDLAQVILPSSMCQELSSQCTRPYREGKGAFIFGFNSTYRWFWGDTGDPSREAADVDFPQIERLFKFPSQDSGIGSSLSSTTFRESESTVDSSIHQSPNVEPFVSSTPFVNSMDNNQTSRKRPCQRSILPHISSKRYTVGIVCALHTELLAVRALFDSTHQPISIPDDDPNYYALGCISNHNVVATCLPDGEYGTNPAANVASNMRRSFPNTKFCLLVGIGGGVPSSKHDIRLGDIVVSTPSGANTGIIPYDLKKALKCGTSVLNGYLHPPPQHLRCALSEIKSDPSLSRAPPLQGYLQQIQECTKDYHHPGHENDRLYAPGYIHAHATKACDSCDSQQQLPRTPRVSLDPVIHYGTIASGNQVIKDAAQRDKLAKQYDILCFEMEAAGIVNTFPSLVIRGICDYADSHKNKMWQKYAAATAASFAKFLLSRVRTPQDSDINS